MSVVDSFGNRPTGSSTQTANIELVGSNLLPRAGVVRNNSIGAAHIGLTPRRFRFSEIDIDGQISKGGIADARCALYTAANAMLTRSTN